MGTAYKVQCRHCGTQFIHSADSGYGVQFMCVGCGDHSNNQNVIKCPGCQRRVNVSMDEFREQIIEETNWE
ncbi:MAG: hypothetical protein R3Y39_04540 [Rikenellaceae bacterium]